MRPGVERPYSAPTTASASADSRALITVCSSDRMRSGLASARASPSMPPGSTMWGAVIVMTPFEGAVRGSLEGSRDGRVYVYNHDELGDRATPLCGTQLLNKNAVQEVRGGHHRGRPLPRLCERPTRSWLQRAMNHPYRGGSSRVLPDSRETVSGARRTSNGYRAS